MVLDKEARERAAGSHESMALPGILEDAEHVCEEAERAEENRRG